MSFLLLNTASETDAIANTPFLQIRNQGHREVKQIHTHYECAEREEKQAEDSTWGSQHGGDETGQSAEKSTVAKPPLTLPLGVICI